ncbi:alcohol dehydrogenase catalytic domain-containing protein [Mycobacterium sp. D16R24]|uniref:zinc-dependent alcohol dehydrogenase n=1 Tax=Mycobacterium sp. D16R24 TaxID=1855656 RepID=UPI00099208FA|nr:alcohol dehydrogenase catalytic domain-containing protein [Mycobacterium sp. D16R24]
MRALTFVGPRELRFDDVDAPVLIDPADALIRPIAATTCDLDQWTIQDKVPLAKLGPFPIGHECVGRVMEVGPGCTLNIGDIVSVAWHIACGTCAECQLGHPARCLKHGDAQYGLPINGQWGGTFSELIRVPFADYNCLTIPAGIDPIHLASLSDNLALGWETTVPTLQKAGIDNPEIAVFGGTGSIGLYVAQVAAALAGGRTVFYDDDPVRMAVAEKIGAEVRDINGPIEDQYDLAVDATCDAEKLRKALLSVRPEGYVNSVGIYFRDVSLPLLALYQRGVNFHNGKGHARPAMDPILENVINGKLQPELVTSGVYAWEQIPDVLAGENPGHKPIFTLPDA